MTAILPVTQSRVATLPAVPVPGTPREVPRLRGSRPDLLVCGVLLALILLVQGWNITGFPNLSDDEGTYLAQAWAVQQGKGLAHYTYWYDHPPLGWIQIAAVTWLPSLFFPDAVSVAPMRCAMLLVSAVSVVLVYVLGRRLGLRRWAAGLGMALFGLSPLSVVLQREIFLDNIAVMWMLVAFCLAASPRCHLWHHFGAGLAAAVAVLSKETMLVILPALLVTMWQHSHRDTRKFAVTGAVTACGLVGLAYPLFALLNNELFPGPGHVSLIDGISYQMSRAGSGFLLSPGSGAHRVLQSWLYYDRVLPLCGLAAAVLLVATARRSRTGRALAGPALAAVILALVALRPSGYLPAMYVIQTLPFLALALAGVSASVVGGAAADPAGPGAPVAGGALGGRRGARRRHGRAGGAELVRRQPFGTDDGRQRPVPLGRFLAAGRGQRRRPGPYACAGRRRDLARPRARRIPARHGRHLVLQGRSGPGRRQDHAARLAGRRLRRRLPHRPAGRGDAADGEGRAGALRRRGRLRHGRRPDRDPPDQQGSRPVRGGRDESETGTGTGELMVRVLAGRARAGHRHTGGRRLRRRRTRASAALLLASGASFGLLLVAPPARHGRGRTWWSTPASSPYGPTASRPAGRSPAGATTTSPSPPPTRHTAAARRCR
ncbi:hypothetical protein GCM10020000_55490 [Streptomyces olivoverticillatus]